MQIEFNTNLALMRLVDMAHSQSLRDGQQGGEMKSPDLRVGFLHEVVAEDNVDVPGTDRPSEHAHLLLDIAHHLDVRARPPSRHVVEKSIFGPPIFGLVGEPDVKLELRRIEELLEGFQAEYD